MAVRAGAAGFAVYRRGHHGMGHGCQIYHRSYGTYCADGRPDASMIERISLHASIISAAAQLRARMRWQTTSTRHAGAARRRLCRMRGAAAPPRRYRRATAPLPPRRYRRATVPRRPSPGGRTRSCPATAHFSTRRPGRRRVARRGSCSPRGAAHAVDKARLMLSPRRTPTIAFTRRRHHLLPMRTRQSP